MTAQNVGNERTLSAWSAEDTERFWEQLLSLIESDNIVPVVGPELLHCNVNGVETTVYALLSEELSRLYNIGVRRWAKYTELSQVVSEIVRKQGREELTNVYYSLWDRYRREKWAPPDALMELAGVTTLSLFVTTTFDTLLADALDAVRYNGRRKTTRLSLSLKAASEYQEAARQKDVTRPASNWDRPTKDVIVYNLFGTGSDDETYAIHDEDALEYVHRFTSVEEVLPAWLTKELLRKRILMIGCHFSDWLNRFIIRRAAAQRLLATSRGKFFIMADNVAGDQEFASFLYLFSPGAQVYPGSAREFVAELSRRWKNRVSTSPKALSSGRGEGREGLDVAKIEVFLSYVREDLGVVRILANAIEKMGAKPWTDWEKINPGEDWNNKTNSGINEALLFFAVISENSEKRQESEIYSEWKKALKRAEKFPPTRTFVIPVVIDPDEPSPINKYRNAVGTLGSTLDYGWAPRGEPDDRLKRTLTEAIRARRIGDR